MPLTPSSKSTGEQILRELIALRAEQQRHADRLSALSLPDPWRLQLVAGSIRIVNTVTGASLTLGAAP